MNLKSLQYGLQYGARYGARLTEKFCRSASFFVTHACTKSLHKAHEKSCTRISNSSSPASGMPSLTLY